MNHAARAISRLIWQYRNAEKMRAWVSIGPDVAQVEIELAAQRVMEMLDIDAGAGVQLDIIGEIVGQSRPFVDAAIFENDWFGWQENPDRRGWGAAWLPRYVAGKSSIQMPDNYYRIMIRAKVSKNTSDATIDSIAQALEFITGASVSNLDDRQDMTFSVVFSKDLSIQVRTILQNFDIVPRPQGVRFLSFSEPVQDEYFGYIGDPNVRPYGVAPYAEVL
ncbi:DUF2612 domain-containing protein [Alloalcanivorax xenomutans]